MKDFKDLDHCVLEDFSFQTKQIFDFDLRLLDIVRDANCKSWFQILKFSNPKCVCKSHSKVTKKRFRKELKEQGCVCIFYKITNFASHLLFG